MAGNLLVRDERERGIDREADHLGYLVLSFGLLAIVAWRGLVRDEASWDLLALVILAGTVATGYRVTHRTANRGMLTLAIVSLVAAAAVGLVLAIVLGSGT